MSCCKKAPQENHCGGQGNFANYFFIVLILYILLAIILGGVI